MGTAGGGRRTCSCPLRWEFRLGLSTENHLNLWALYLNGDGKICLAARDQCGIRRPMAGVDTLD